MLPYIFLSKLKLVTTETKIKNKIKIKLNLKTSKVSKYNIK